MLLNQFAINIRDDHVVTICEIKYSEQPFIIDKACAANLQRKMAVFRKRTGCEKDIFIAFISAAGVKPSIYSEEMISGIVTLEDLFDK